MMMKFPGGKLKALTLSYDDGVIYDKKLIEIMAAHGLKGTFNINSGLFAKEEGQRRMTEKTAKKLYTDYGMEVAVHGLYHLFPSELSDERKVYEFMQDKANIEELFGKIIRGMAYAYGNYDDATVEVLRRCGIIYARTTKFTEKFDIPTDFLRLPTTCHHRNPKLMELAQQFCDYSLDPKAPWRAKPQLFYLWGHSYEFNDNDNWYIIEDFAKLIGGRDDIWYATNIEIFEYITAYKQLIFSADGKIICNPTATDIYFFEGDKDYVIKSGETIKL